MTTLAVSEKCSFHTLGPTGTPHATVLHETGVSKTAKKRSFECEFRRAHRANKKRTGPSPPSPLLAAPNVTAHLSTASVPTYWTLNGQCFIQTPKHWGGGKLRLLGGSAIERRRRRDRDAEGVEGVGNGEGVSPSPADCELPQRGPGRSPAENEFGAL